MKRKQIDILFCFLIALIVFQCDHYISGGDCVYKEISGYIEFIERDTLYSKKESYYQCRFISSDYSDTISDCYTIADVGCFNDGIISLDSLHPCIWKKKISGGCEPGFIKINSIPDSCYAGGGHIRFYE